MVAGNKGITATLPYQALWLAQPFTTDIYNWHCWAFSPAANGGGWTNLGHLSIITMSSWVSSVATAESSVYAGVFNGNVYELLRRGVPALVLVVFDHLFGPSQKDAGNGLCGDAVEVGHGSPFEVERVTREIR